MSLVAALLAPLAMLLPAAGAVEPQRERDAAGQPAPVQGDAAPGRLALPGEAALPAFDPAGATVFRSIAESFRAMAQNQVRIEQRMTIRIAPRPSPAQPNFLVDLPQRPLASRLAERDAGRCLPISGIAGVQVSGADRLILYMRDQRVISAALERSCRARDFYSGFYVERNADGQICVKRDTLLSRSGANCKLSRIKQLVEAGN
jgi:hypothetical protein